MSLHTYGYGALLLLCGALYAWGALQGARVEAKQRTVEARESTISSLNGSLAQAKKTNDASLASIGILKADLRWQSEIATKFSALARKNAADLNKALEAIRDAPESDDGPVPLVLERELDRLRARSGTGGPDRGSSGAAGSP